jgi:hypothetical protein
VSESVLGAVCDALRGSKNMGSVFTGIAPSGLGLRPISIPRTSGPLLAILDAIVKQQGELNWHLTYSGVSGGPVRLSFWVFDGWGPSQPECAW